MVMKRISLSKLLPFFTILLTLTFTGCASIHHGPQRSMSSAISKYLGYAFKNLGLYFKRAGVSYPPKDISLLVFKNSHRVQLWAKDRGPWRYIRSFPILASSGGPGPKLHDGDHQVPEGVYKIVGFNPASRFDLSLMLNYPNSADRYYARLDHRHDLGDDIFIHGSDASIGCIPIGNKAIEQLFVLAYLVGERHIKVIIAPDDLRYHAPIYGAVHPRWLPQLYAQIRQALQPYG
ncbi:L,D-transpeptidase family protein [Coxiella burnetii]|uniref:L,D-transpeptidase family protein n=1 Tax=Coxiella burnetii TaxID=777 RepID=UPI000CCBD894|nr:L,D-transpeptidase family protein [Coxiella burnetii]PNT88747.1 hypothetical protein C2L89_06900 [Coxiella burnetii]